ncbi:MAG: carboxypeptidase M32 [Candidatus Bathyarchaeia archaeon]
MSQAEKLFEKLLEHVKAASKFEYAASLLEWDQETKMPPKGAEGRAEIFAAVKTEGFKIFTSEEVGKILKELMKEKEKLDVNKQALVQRINEVYHRTKAIPTDLFKTFNETKSKAYHIWVEAKNKSDFKIFTPSLEKILEIRRRFAELYGYEKNPYDGLLPDYEPGLTAEDLRTIVKDLRRELVPFVQTLLDKADKPNEKILEGNFPENLQHEFSLEVLKALGYDFDRGRLDTTVHPFTIGVGPDDVRVTTNYNVKKLDSALFATIHECGHALYDQGKDALLKWIYMDTGYSHGVHESQSRMMENMVGRSLAFWKFFYPKLQSYFPSFRKVPVEEFYRAVNAVKPSLIRIFADEVTYNLHIMLRFEIEEAMLKGDVEVKELPALWNEKMQEYLGITPKKDSEGVLQDVHWSMGYIGYFPSYMLGNLYAAQLFATAKQEIKDLEEKIAQGKFNILLTWLRNKVHRFGLIYEAPQLLKEVTGQGPTSKPWLEYIKEKFTKIYI